MSKKYFISTSLSKNPYASNKDSYIYNLISNDKVLQSIHFIDWGHNSWEMHILYINGEKDLSYLWNQFLKDNNCRYCVTPDTNKELKKN